MSKSEVSYRQIKLIVTSLEIKLHVLAQKLKFIVSHLLFVVRSGALSLPFPHRILNCDLCVQRMIYSPQLLMLPLSLAEVHLVPFLRPVLGLLIQNRLSYRVWRVVCHLLQSWKHDLVSVCSE